MTRNRAEILQQCGCDSGENPNIATAVNTRADVFHGTRLWKSISARSERKAFNCEDRKGSTKVAEKSLERRRRRELQGTERCTQGGFDGKCGSHTLPAVRVVKMSVHGLKSDCSHHRRICRTGI